MKKRLISLLLSGVLACGLLAGCGSATGGIGGAKEVTEDVTEDLNDIYRDSYGFDPYDSVIRTYLDVSNVPEEDLLVIDLERTLNQSLLEFDEDDSNGEFTDAVFKELLEEKFGVTFVKVGDQTLYKSSGQVNSSGWINITPYKCLGYDCYFMVRTDVYLDDYIRKAVTKDGTEFTRSLYGVSFEYMVLFTENSEELQDMFDTVKDYAENMTLSDWEVQVEDVSYDGNDYTEYRYANKKEIIHYSQEYKDNYPASDIGWYAGYSIIYGISTELASGLVDVETDGYADRCVYIDGTFEYTATLDENDNIVDGTEVEY